MRRKGEIWKPQFQKLIVKRYKSGMPVGEILELPELQAVDASEYLVRQILKKNKVKTIWQRAKIKEELWEPEVVNFIVSLRNSGHSYSKIKEKVVSRFPGISVSRSSIVRVLEENSKLVEHDSKLSAAQRERISDLIVEKYKTGTLVKEIISLPELQKYQLSEHVVRTILKEKGVRLTGRKGELRRWPEELQKRIVNLYQEGMTFEEIKQEKGIAENNPTDYAIRNILRRKGVVTRKPSYLQPISSVRYRKYRDNKLHEKEISLIHKHLARFSEGRHLMLSRIGLDDLKIDGISCLTELEKDSLIINADRWKGFFHWGMQFLYDDALKKKIFNYGLEYTRAVSYLRKACEMEDQTRLKRGWNRISKAMQEMSELQKELLLQPAKRFEMEIPER
jgi:predicted Zn-ribbon and HTH transcriptional regulator